MFRGDRESGWRTGEEKRSTEQRLSAVERRQDEVERFQKVLAAIVDRLRRRVEEQT